MGDEFAELDESLTEAFEAIATLDSPFDACGTNSVSELFELADEVQARHLSSRERSFSLVEMHGCLASRSSLLVPSGLFKSWSADTPTDGETYTSSGTMGSVSCVPRDAMTTENCLTGIASAARSILNLGSAGTIVANFTDPVHTGSPSWMSSLVGALGVFHRVYELADLSPQVATEVVAQAAAPGSTVLVVGPPGRIADLARKSSLSGFPPDCRLLVLSVGGWKSTDGVIDPLPFRKLVSASFGCSMSDVRDAYGMVELNSVLIECERGFKHVPPWVVSAAIEPRSRAQVAPGARGVLAFFDASAVSYPSYVLSEDVGSVRDDCCACGTPGQRVDVERRLELVEGRGCALTSTPAGERR